jgi:hypothetical protein
MTGDATDTTDVREAAGDGDGSGVDARGQVGTETRPLRALYTRVLDGGVTGGEPVTGLVGDGLAITDDDELSAAPARPTVDDGTGTDATSVTNAVELSFGAGFTVSEDGDGTVTVDFESRPPTVRIAAETTSTVVGASPTFAAVANDPDPDGTIDTYEWTVDGTDAGTGPLLTRTFASAGSYEVAVTVTDDDGRTASASTTVSVAATTAPTVGIDVSPSSPGTGETVELTATVDGSAATAVRWYVDGSPAGRGGSIDRTFATEGDRRVRVVVAGDGDVAGATRRVGVYDGTPLRTPGDLRNVLGTSGRYVLAEDIDMSGEDYSPPDGFSSFEGTLDGRGHEISGLELARVPFFSGLGSGATVEHVAFTDVSGTDIPGIFGLLVESGATVRDVLVSATILQTNGRDQGGICGASDGTIERVVADVTLTHASDTSGNYAGGLVGQNGTTAGGTIRDSIAFGAVRGAALSGGLVGRDPGSIERSVAACVVPDTGGGFVHDDSGGSDPDGYWNQGINASDVEDAAGGDIAGVEPLRPSQMVGSAAETNMSGLDFDDTWSTVSGGYPRPERTPDP